MVDTNVNFDVNALGRKELQALAKDFGIKANQKSNILREKLRETFSVLKQEAAKNDIEIETARESYDGGGTDEGGKYTSKESIPTLEQRDENCAETGNVDEGNEQNHVDEKGSEMLKDSVPAFVEATICNVTKTEIETVSKSNDGGEMNEGGKYNSEESIPTLKQSDENCAETGNSDEGNEQNDVDEKGSEMLKDSVPAFAETISKNVENVNNAVDETEKETISEFLSFSEQGDEAEEKICADTNEDEVTKDYLLGLEQVEDENCSESEISTDGNKNKDEIVSALIIDDNEDALVNDHGHEADETIQYDRNEVEVPKVNVDGDPPFEIGSDAKKQSEVDIDIGRVGQKIEYSNERDTDDNEDEEEMLTNTNEKSKKVPQNESAIIDFDNDEGRCDEDIERNQESESNNGTNESVNERDTDDNEYLYEKEMLTNTNEKCEEASRNEIVIIDFDDDEGRCDEGIEQNQENESNITNESVNERDTDDNEDEEEMPTNANEKCEQVSQNEIAIFDFDNDEGRCDKGIEQNQESESCIINGTNSEVADDTIMFTIEHGANDDTLNNAVDMIEEKVIPESFIIFDTKTRSEDGIDINPFEGNKLVHSNFCTIEPNKTASDAETALDRSSSLSEKSFVEEKIEFFEKIWWVGSNRDNLVEDLIADKLMMSSKTGDTTKAPFKSNLPGNTKFVTKLPVLRINENRRNEDTKPLNLKIDDTRIHENRSEDAKPLNLKIDHTCIKQNRRSKDAKPLNVKNDHTRIHKNKRREDAKPLNVEIDPPIDGTSKPSTMNKRTEIPLWKVHSKDFLRKGGTEKNGNSNQNTGDAKKKLARRRPFADRLNTKVDANATTNKGNNIVKKKNTPILMAMSKRNEEQMKKFMERQSVGRQDRAEREKVKKYAHYVRE